MIILAGATARLSRLSWPSRPVVVASSLLALAAGAVAQELPLPGPLLDGPPPQAAPPASAASANATGTRAASGRGEPLWEIGLGAAAVRFPDYRGSDESSLYVLPLPFVAYRGRFLRADRDGARAILFAGPRLQVDVSVAASTPTKSDDNDARRGMKNLHGTFEIGPNVNVELWQTADRGVKVDLRLPVREAVTLERSPRRVGATFSPNLNVDLRGLAGPWNVGLLAGPLYAERRFHRYFYGVDAADANAQRPAYDAPGGYAGWRALAAFSRRIGNAWLGGFIRYDDLHGARFGDSPLARKDTALTAGFGVSWIFATSDARVVTDD